MRIHSGSPQSKDASLDDLHLQRVFLMIAAGWTIAMGISISSALDRVRSGALDLAREGAATAYAKDALYRRWNTEHGGSLCAGHGGHSAESVSPQCAGKRH